MICAHLCVIHKCFIDFYVVNNYIGFNNYTIGGSAKINKCTSTSPEFLAFYDFAKSIDAMQTLKKQKKPKQTKHKQTNNQQQINLKKWLTLHTKC